MSDFGSTLREWSPLTNLFNLLPTKSHSGLFYHDVKLTCIDVLPEFLALGTNLGIVYWYDRKNKSLQRLRCESTNSVITAVKIVSTVDFMVACGNSDGYISIFQIPKNYPDSLPENLRPKNKQVERYTVSELHKAAISALEWSKNGMKLFSGDKNGIVVLTEIDFYMHLCKSAEIINESYEVVQLSYYQHYLLISTTYRSIICKRLEKWEVSQIGKKDRKVLGPFGGIFFKNGLRFTDTILYCTRPGLRIWASDIQGCVQQTLLFKDLLSKECPEVPIINPISDNLRNLQPRREASFGVLLPFNNDLLVTYGNDVVYILNPKDMSVIACMSTLRRVLSIAADGDELFILEGERSLIRVSYKPEYYPEATSSSHSGKSFIPLSTSIRDITTKLQTAVILPAIPPLMQTSIHEIFNVHTDTTSVVNAEEAKESPVKHKQHMHSQSGSAVGESQKKFDVYNKIGQQDFDDTILFKHHKRKKKQSDMAGSTSNLSSSSSDDRETSISHPTLMNLSTVGALPDLRSPDSILNDIKHKERILADVLNLDKVRITDEDIKKDINKDECGFNTETDFVADDDTYSSIFSQSGNTLVFEDQPKGKDQNKGVRSKNKKEEAVTDEHFTVKSFKKYLPDFGKVRQESQPLNIPDCVHIPNQWKLSDIKLHKEPIESSTSDGSLTDWEII